MSEPGSSGTSTQTLTCGCIIPSFETDWSTPEALALWDRCDRHQTELDEGNAKHRLFSAALRKRFGVANS